MKDIKQKLALEIAKITGIQDMNIAQMIEYPPNQTLGDLALPCFRFAKVLRKSPQQIAEEIRDQINTHRDLDSTQSIAEVNATNGYLNVKLNRKMFSTQIVQLAIHDVHKLFSMQRGIGKKAAIDYSSPNIAKPFGVGHLRSTIIGASLLRFLRADGYEAVGVNHLGDWGTQFGKNIAAYLRWGDEEVVRANPIRELFQLYVKFHQEALEHPELDEEARMWFKRLEDGDKQATELWKWFIDESLQGFKKTYDLLGVSFDYYLGESFYNDKMQAIVTELQEKHLLQLSDGAEVVDLSKWDMPPCIIRKSDGATIYATRDLAAADYRHNALGATHLIYVVGAEQTLHFQQVFKVLELMGRDWAHNCTHVAFGMMKYNGERLSTRKGKVVYLEDVLQRAIEEARKIIENKNPNLQDKEQVAQMIGIGAVIFNDLKTYRMHDVDFRYEDVLNFDGETGPYAQYTHTRACSVLRKAREQGLPTNFENEVHFNQVTESEWGLIYQLGLANELFERTIDELDPSIFARYILQICHAFNRFYHDDPILSAHPAQRDQRIALTDATRAVLAQALYFIGLQAPSAM